MPPLVYAASSLLRIFLIPYMLRERSEPDLRRRVIALRSATGFRPTKVLVANQHSGRDTRSTVLGAIGACRQLRCRRRVFAPGAGAPTANIRLPCALRRSTALGAIGACRQLRRRRRVFAPGAGAPTANIRLPCALRRSTALGAIGACRQLRCRRWAFAPGAGAPTAKYPSALRTP